MREVLLTSVLPFLAETLNVRPSLDMVLGTVHWKLCRPPVSEPWLMVSTTWPAALITLIETLAALPLKSKAPAATVLLVPSSALTVPATNWLPSTSTWWPTRLAPCSNCIWLKPSVTPPMVVLSFSMPVTVLIWAIWLVTCALSIGLSGSWFCICVTSSLRKRSDASVVLSLAVAVVPLILSRTELPVDDTELMSCP